MNLNKWIAVRIASWLIVALFVSAPFVTTNAFADRAVVVGENERVVAVDDDEDDDDGLFSGPFDVVGEVLAFPFRLVANVLDGIF